jgi:hypothetical protein
MNKCGSRQFNDTIWSLNIECGITPANIAPFDGHVDSVAPYSTENIEHLIISFMLYEPQGADNYTCWTRDTLDYLHEFQMLPKLKYVYLLHESTRVNIQDLPDYYMNFSHNPRYFLLRSEGTEEKSVGVDYSKKWIDTGWHDHFEDSHAVWLVGDITNRVHKLPLLYKFLQSDTIDQLNYSLSNNLNYDQPFRKEDTQEYLGLIQTMNDVFDLDLDYDSLCELYKRLENTLPGDRFSEMIDAEVHSFDIANYVFPTEWNDACLIIMPETWYEHPGKSHQDIVGQDINLSSVRNFWEHNIYPTTEKTWKAIATKKPFMGISKHDLQEKTLESLGFKTFRYYTSHADLIDDLDLKDTIDVAHERIISFIHNSKSYREGIEEDIEYNYNHWKNILRHEWDLLYGSCPPLKHVNKNKLLRLFTVASDNVIHLHPDYVWDNKSIIAV